MNEMSHRHAEETNSIGLFDANQVKMSTQRKSFQINNIDESQHIHSEFILNGLQVLKTNNLLCDVVLIAENKRFHVHKILLASVSDYFRSMFTSGMRETSQTSIELKGVSSRGLEKVIEIIYTSQTKFDSYTDIFDVISAANHLQCLLVIDYCEKNFLSRLTSSNFNYFIQMAKLYDLPNALKQIELFIVNNFAQIISHITTTHSARTNKKSKFTRQKREYSPKDVIDGYDIAGAKYLSYEQMLNCLRHDQLKIKEIDLFMLTWRWINECLLDSSSNLTDDDEEATIKSIETKCKKKLQVLNSSKRSSGDDEENDDSDNKNEHKEQVIKVATTKRRSNHSRCAVAASKLDIDLKRRVKTDSSCCLRKIDIIRNLLACIRFGLISPTDIINRVQTVNKLMLNDKILRKIIINALNYHLTPNNYVFYNDFQLRQQFKADSNDENDLPFNINIRSPVKCVLVLGGREINPNPSLNDSCSILTDFVHLSSSITSNCASMNTSVQKSCLSTLPLSLSHMQVVVVGNFLYVLGGCISQCAHGESAVSNTFRYDPRLSKWTSTTSMLERRAYFYACSLQSTTSDITTQRNEYIVAFGGKNRDGALSSVEKFDISKNEWSYVNQLPSSYYAHSGVCVNQNTTCYISGGYSNGNFTADLHSYSLATNEWHELRPMHAARGWHSMCVINDNLYVFGGCYLVSPVFGASNQNFLNQQQQQMAQPVTVTEYYTPSSDQWTIVKPIVNLHKEASHFLLGQYVYIFGGYNIAAKTGQKLMSRYDAVNDLWQTMGQFSSGMTGVGCCVLDLPWYALDSTNQSSMTSSLIENNNEYHDENDDCLSVSSDLSQFKCELAEATNGNNDDDDENRDSDDLYSENDDDHDSNSDVNKTTTTSQNITNEVPDE